MNSIGSTGPVGGDKIVPAAAPATSRRLLLGTILSPPPPVDSLTRVLRIAVVFVFGIGVSWPSFAAFEDMGSGAIPAALGEALGAVPMGAASVDYNPAGVGQAESMEIQAGYKTSPKIPSAAVDYHQMSAAGAMPLGTHDALGASWQQTSRQNLFLDSALAATYATRKWRETDYGFLDFGITAKGLRRSSRLTGKSVTEISADAGALYRLDGGRIFGASVFNVNRPKIDVGGLSDRAPLMGRIGFSQVIREFSMSVDVTERESTPGTRGGAALGAGVQYWRSVPKWGSWAGRMGLSLSDPSKFWTWGLGWRIYGAQVDYALMVPLASGKRFGNAVSFLFRFGNYDPEKEYEKVLGTEISLRQELTRILDRSELKQKQLSQELDQLRAEIKSLQAALAGVSAEKAAAKERLQAYEEKERRARETLEALEQERRAAALRTKESLYREDWTAYQKLKGDGVADAILIDRLQQMLRQYKETGVDLSEANQELLRLLRNRP